MFMCLNSTGSESMGQCTEQEYVYVTIFSVLHYTIRILQSCDRVSISCEGLRRVLMSETTGLKLSQCSRPDTQISIYVRMTVGNKSDNDACEGLSHFGWRFRVLVRRCVLSGYANNSRGYFLLLACPHPVFLVKSRGVVMFKKFVEFL